jgi:hypothetical protein
MVTSPHFYERALTIHRALNIYELYTQYLDPELRSDEARARKGRVQLHMAFQPE